MADVLTPIDDLFASPDFGQHLTEWQRARLNSDKREGQLFDHLTQRYTDANPGATEDDFGETISWYLEMPPEEFEENNYYDKAAIDIHSSRETAQFEEHAAKSALLEFSKNQGVSQFALYGLWLHTRESGVITATDLKSKAETVERDFEPIDRLVRDNPGQVLTIVDTFSYAGRLGVGGITIVDNDYVSFPLANESEGYGVSFLKEDTKIHPETRLRIHPSGIHSIFGSENAKIFENWADIMDVNSWNGTGRGATFALGEPVEGPPVISADRDKAFFELVFNRVRAIGNAAAHGTVA